MKHKKPMKAPKAPKKSTAKAKSVAVVKKKTGKSPFGAGRK